MPQLKKLTPNLIVSNVERSIAFYRDILGFTLTTTVPETGPFVFAIILNGAIELFLNAQEASYAEYPAFKDIPLGGSFTLFIEVEHIRDLYDSMKDRVRVLMPFEQKWYGMTEFAFADPDGYVITFAERTA